MKKKNRWQNPALLKLIGENEKKNPEDMVKEKVDLLDFKINSFCQRGSEKEFKVRE